MTQNQMKWLVRFIIVGIVAAAVLWLVQDYRKSHYVPALYTDAGLTMNARTSGDYLQIYRQGQWEKLYIKGVNLGTALPGKWFTEFPEEEETYTEWFEQIGAMNANTVRVYTLLNPQFYKALLEYNQAHRDQPLYLLQEIWPEENPAGGDLLQDKYQDSLRQEIRYGIDAIHGQAVIKERKGRAWGEYKSNVAPYLLGYLVGRELEPQEVAATDKLNAGAKYSGAFLGVAEGSPTEVFLARACNYVAEYEGKTYHWQHPVAIVSWPTLDPMLHDTELNEQGKKSLEYNDSETVDICDIDRKPALKCGFFGAYHIYPNYPDFMNEEPSYDQYHDQEGRLRYGGYLRDFRQHSHRYPSLVAEFGLATGMGRAHYSPDGYHHGGMTETQQGQGIARMAKAIEREGYMGSVIFEWMDEWAKKTWTDEAVMIPYERHVLWHNAVDPEQNYGILAYEAIEPKKTAYELKGSDAVKKLGMKANESYLYLEIKADGKVDLNRQEWMIGLDTYDRSRGDFRFPGAGGLKTPTGMEFMISLHQGNRGSLQVIPSYNPGSYRFASRKSDKGIYENIEPIINKARVTNDGRQIAAIRDNFSTLRYGAWTDNAHWYIDDDLIRIRIPWTRLNVTDPTSFRVLNDPGKYYDYPARDTLKTIKTQGFNVYIQVRDGEGKTMGLLPGNRNLSKTAPYLWANWDYPLYQSRLKASYYIVRDAFARM
ncbi:MAG: hypothetical protein ACM3PE_04760 [Deltaproteobacteria bacterium]